MRVCGGRWGARGNGECQPAMACRPNQSSDGTPACQITGVAAPVYVKLRIVRRLRWRGDGLPKPQILQGLQGSQST